MADGKFITLEGGEGTGKTTQAQRLADRLRAAGIDAVITREPGGSPFAERLRNVLLDPSVPDHPPLSEALVFYAARADHLDTVIRPALRNGQWVICDRFSDSTRAYQGAAGELDASVIDHLDDLVVGTTQPDLTLIIDLDPKIGMQRADDRRKAAASKPQNQSDRDRFEGRADPFHAALRNGFLDIAKRYPERAAVVDGAVSADLLADTIWSVVKTRLPALETW